MNLMTKINHFTHPDFDPIWKKFTEVGSPFVVHVAVNGHYKAVPDSFKIMEKQN